MPLIALIVNPRQLAGIRSTTSFNGERPGSTKLKRLWNGWLNGISCRMPSRLMSVFQD
jgi:hypothetical protein